MNILLIGNGFDLEHGLPTTYVDFLRFTRTFVNCLVEYRHIEGVELLLTTINKARAKKNCNPYVLYYINNLFIEKEKDQNAKEARIIDTLHSLIDNNFWIDYFYEKDHIGTGWIDFEADISIYIQKLDDIRKQSEKNKKTAFTHRSRQVLDINDLDRALTLVYNDGYVPVELLNEWKERLFVDLNRLIKCLELYLSECVEKIKCKKSLIGIERLNIDHLISFNYTNTFSRVYGDRIILNSENIDYLHGRAQYSINNGSHIVLGIDEYIDNEPEKSNDNEYIQFKKFYQRIYRKTGCIYKKWVEDINTVNGVINKAETHNLYIIGHSLSATDKDTLRELILLDNMYTTIYYHSDKTYADQIAHMVEILTEDKVIEMVYGNSPKLRFCNQKILEN